MSASAESTGAFPSRWVLGARVDATCYSIADQRICHWASGRESHYVCLAPVHTIMEAFDSPEFQAIINAADLVTPDGVPVVWALRLLGARKATRVYGPDLTLVLCERAAREGISIGFYGGTPSVLAKAVETLKQRYAGLEVVYEYSPPFRQLTDDEDAEITRAINDSGVRILFVGLGCPKQERWMASHRGKINAVMLGVGAAFDFIAGTKPQAPRFVMKIGMEWAFRLATEPRRLAWRYLYHNPRFVYHFGRQLLSGAGRAEEVAQTTLKSSFRRDGGRGREDKKGRDDLRERHDTLERESP